MNDKKETSTFPNWTKVDTHFDLETGDHRSNVPFGPLLVSDGNWIEYVNEHGWDKEEYYFHNGNGKLENVTYWMQLPEAPK